MPAIRHQRRRYHHLFHNDRPPDRPFVPAPAPDPDSRIGAIYKRPGVPTIYVRDRLGRYEVYRIGVGRAILCPGGIFTLGPVYGRVDFGNNVRFNGRVRSLFTLQTEFEQTPAANRITTDWIDLPQSRDHARRTTNQGMTRTMIALTHADQSASAYVAWFHGRHAGVGLDHQSPWEWCHLLAHSMGGPDDETNIVAARQGNNTEQLAIESALQMYRMERRFAMNITAAKLDGGDGRYIGNVIRYQIRCIDTGEWLSIFLDCLNAPSPSAIHFYDLLRTIVRWANRQLEIICVRRNPLSWAEELLVKEARGLH